MSDEHKNNLLRMATSFEDTERRNAYPPLVFAAELRAAVGHIDALTAELAKLQETAAAKEAECAAECADGVGMIAAERQRQIETEGWTAEHDDKEHGGGQLAKAAACYAAGEPIFVQRIRTVSGRKELPVVIFDNVWPFESQWYKPKDTIRNLVRAGAMIAAEIDRLNRTALAARKEPHDA